MTENEAISALKLMSTLRVHPFYGYQEMSEVRDMAIKALEEIQQYRALGTIEELKSLKEQFLPHQIDGTSCKHRNCNKCDKYRKENEKYHEIGTVEECRAAVENYRPRVTNAIPIGNKYYICSCGSVVKDGEKCLRCGDTIDRTEEGED